MNKDSILFELKEIDMLLVRRIMKEAKKCKEPPLSPIQGRIITYLLKHKKEKVYQRDLEKVLGLRRSTISGILQTMEKNNIIKRVEVKEDARIKQIILTNTALNKHKEIGTKIKKIEKLIRNDIPKKDLQTFFNVVNQIKENLKERDD